MASSDEYYYNEHDENQVRKIYKKNKKKRLKRRVKILAFLFVFVLVGSYFLSDYSKVQSIHVVGNEEVTTKDILTNISADKTTLHFMARPSQIEKEVKNIPHIKKASVRKDFMGNITIEVKEADKVAYCVIGKSTYVIDEIGDVVETKDKKIIQSLHSCPQLSNFKDIQFLKQFAKEYVQISELIKNQTSDIVYDPKAADETRLKFIMNNGKILYLRVEDMVKQLARFDYEAFMTAYSEQNVFSFEGDYVYMKKDKDNSNDRVVFYQNL